MDNRFSRRWSMTPDPVQAAPASTPLTPHVSPQKYAAASYSAASLSSRSPSGGASKQRWSTVTTSSLSIVETIDYETEEAQTPPSPAPTQPSTLSKRKSIVNLKVIMRQIFSKKDREVLPPLPTKPAVVKPVKSSKSDPVVLKNIPEKEQHLWSRLSIVVRPPKVVDPPTATVQPKRIDSGVDMKSLKEALASKREPKYPSTTSLPTFPTAHTRSSSVTTNITITGPPMLLTGAERMHLINELRHAQKLVQAHAHEAEAFSTNLAGLLWSKDRYIIANKRLTEETRLQMIDTMTKVRDTTAKTFARKGAFYERTLSVLDKLLTELNANPEKLKGNSSTSSLRSMSPDSTLSTSLTLTNSPSNESDPLSNEKHEVPLTLPVLRSGLQTLKADLTAHSHLDPALRNGVVKPTTEEKFPTTENERLAMRRFVRFVDGRVKKLGEGYWEMGRWLRALESWVDDLEESGC